MKSMFEKVKMEVENNIWKNQLVLSRFFLKYK